MKDQYGFDAPVVDLCAIGKEMVRASQFESHYYALQEDYEELSKKYQELLDSSMDHSKQMVGSFLELALSGKIK